MLQQRLKHFAQTVTLSLSYVSLSYALLLLCGSVYAEQILTTEDGRQVILKDDGSWAYVYRDRVVTNALGERFVLHPDGQWSPAKVDQGAKTATPGNSKPNRLPPQQQSATADSGVNLLLSDVTVFRKKIEGLKSTRIETRTEFTLRLVNRSDADVTLNAIDPAQFLASTSRGQNIRVVEVIPDERLLQSGAQQEVKVICSGSPRWMRADYIRLEIEANALGNSVGLILDKSMDEVKVVKGF